MRALVAMAAGLGKLGLAALATLALLELGVRIFAPQVLPHDVPDLWTPDPEMGWHRAPGVRILANTGERGVEICTDAQGDRIHCSANRPPVCRRRILVIGDSFVEALAIPFRQTVWARIEEDTGACVEVAGVAAYGLGQYLKLARERVTAPEPYDLVILSFFAGNDFTEDAERIPPAKEVQRKPLHLLPRGLSAAALYDWFYPYNAWFESRSHAFVAARFAIRRFQDPTGAGPGGVLRCMRPSLLSDAILDETARGIRLIAEEVERGGAALLVVLVPFQSQVLDPTGERTLSAFPQLEGDLDMDLVSDRLVPRLEPIDGIAALVDLLPFLRERATPGSWGTRDTHFSPQGHELWFEAIREPVRALLDEPASRGQGERKAASRAGSARRPAITSR
jgi:hypothetical protein